MPLCSWNIAVIFYQIRWSCHQYILPSATVFLSVMSMWYFNDGYMWQQFWGYLYYQHVDKSCYKIIYSLVFIQMHENLNYFCTEQDKDFGLNSRYNTQKERLVTYVAKKSTRTGFWLCSTLSSKSWSSCIVTIWLDDNAELVWRNEADGRITLDGKWLFCVEIKFVGGLHADNCLTGMHRALHTSCLVTRNVTLDAIAETQ